MFNKHYNNYSFSYDSEPEEKKESERVNSNNKGIEEAKISYEMLI